MDEVTSKTVEIKSKVAKSSTTFRWQIDDFDHICPEGVQKFGVIRSPKFTAGEDIGKRSRWYVHIKGVEEYFGCHLFLNGSNDDKVLPIRCSFKIALGNPVNPFVYSRSFDHTYIEKNGFGNVNFIKISNLHEKKELIQGNRLQISVQMTLYGDLTHRTISPVETKDPETMKRFVSDFDNLFQSKSFSDVEVKCEEKTFYCHKGILSARSEVFRAMFSQPMTEANYNKVTIVDMRSPVMEILLKYIYTSKVDLPSDDSVKLTEIIYGAEKYDLPELKNFCLNQMLEVMSEENIGELVAASQMYNADEEVKKVIKNYCKERLFNLLDNPEFRNILFKYPQAVYD